SPAVSRLRKYRALGLVLAAIAGVCLVVIGTTQYLTHRAVEQTRAALVGKWEHVNEATQTRTGMEFRADGTFRTLGAKQLPVEGTYALSGPRLLTLHSSDQKEELIAHVVAAADQLT